MRRAERKLSTDATHSILHKGEYGILSTTSNDGIPYGVPINFCVIDQAIYFHCAMEGRKLSNIDENQNVSFCVVGNTKILPEKFGTQYESVILSGKALEVFGKDKQKGLEGLLQKYSPAHMDNGLQYIKQLIDKTKVFKIAIEELSGKAREQ